MIHDIHIYIYIYIYDDESGGGRKKKHNHARFRVGVKVRVRNGLENLTFGAKNSISGRNGAFPRDQGFQR